MAPVALSVAATTVPETSPLVDASCCQSTVRMTSSPDAVRPVANSVKKITIKTILVSPFVSGTSMSFPVRSYSGRALIVSISAWWASISNLSDW